MALAIYVGPLVNLSGEEEQNERKSLAEANEVLAEKGLSQHVEPESLPELTSRAAVTGFPYSSIHYLRRFYARLAEDPDWEPTPVEDGEDPADDPVVEEESTMLDSHLLCHSDCEGYYFPIELNMPVIDSKAEDDDGRILGGLLGSSFDLFDELVDIAPNLGITLGKEGELSDAEAERINQEAKQDGRFRIELAVWMALYEAARLSIEHKTAVVFG